MSKANDLLSLEAAAETLGIDEAEVGELIESAELRRVWNREGNSSDAELKAFVLGADVERLKQENSPAYLAKLATGVILPDDDEGDNARTLAAKMPRL